MTPRTWTLHQFFTDGGWSAFLDELLDESRVMLEQHGATEAEITTALDRYEHDLLAALLTGMERMVTEIEAGALNARD